MNSLGNKDFYATINIFNTRKPERICLAFGGHICFVAGFEFEIRPAGADLRRCGLSDYLSFYNSYLLKVGLAGVEYKESFNLLCVHNCAFLGDNQGQF